jgi:hypothetical protein
MVLRDSEYHSEILMILFKLKDQHELKEINKFIMSFSMINSYAKELIHIKQLHMEQQFKILLLKEINQKKLSIFYF